MKPLITPQEAEALIKATVRLLPHIKCPIKKCSGRILRETITADRPFPPFNRSMMDGYAIRAGDIDESGIFEVTTQAPAGLPEQTIGITTRACAEIMTGAMVPSDADCIVPYELTQRTDETHIRLIDPRAHASGDYIHSFASDRLEGEEMLTAGSLIGSREIAVAASCGAALLTVSRKPSIAIVSTGDELVDIAQQPEAHQIRRSNDVMIEAALNRLDLSASQFAHLPDEPQASKAQLAKLIEDNDIVILSGGISMGKKDFIPDALDALGLTCQFHGVAQKPGKPLGFWTESNCAVFTLPGNPISALTCLHHYVIPGLFHAMGQSETVTAYSVQIDRSTRARDDFTVFLPVERGAGNIVSSQPANNSGDLVRILQSDGYIELPPTNEKSYPAGKSFDFHPWF